MDLHCVVLGLSGALACVSIEHVCISPEGFTCGTVGSASDIEKRRWAGTIQFAWAHPNAVAESPGLGGVAVMDGEDLRIWDGTQWRLERTWDNKGQPFLDLQLSVPVYLADEASRWFKFFYNSPVGPARPLRAFCLDCMGGGRPYPWTFFPPLIEESATNRLLLFRDGIRAAGELRFDRSKSEQRWEKPYLGLEVSSREGVRTYPQPPELLSPESIVLIDRSDPATNVPVSGGSTSVWEDGEPPHNTVENLFWPFRLFTDPDTGRVRILTHRGAVWQVGSEAIGDLGEPCQSTDDCAVGSCVDGVCCDNRYCDGTCVTCNGSNPGHCEPIATGQPDPEAGCGAGECAAVCPGTFVPNHELSTYNLAWSSFPGCVSDPAQTCGPAPTCTDGIFTPAGQCTAGSNTCDTSGVVPAACTGGLGCNSQGTACNTACSSRGDCAGAFFTCASDGLSCVPDRTSNLATALGVTPAEWAEPEARSLEEIAQVLVEQGFPVDEEGRVISPLSFGGVTLALDPTLRTPLLGLKYCALRIQACAMSTTASIDACVAAMPRCESSTPWLGDPAGIDCCPETCLEQYFEARPAKSEGGALNEIVTSTCYPGLEEFLEAE